MAKIARLPLHVANQIAAGEVIERPASVVKELVENALDAGASRITVEVSEGGRHLRVIDDGEGMDPEDAVAAFERFATSKVRDAEALWALTTMGFRGEALASIASIARVECQTRARGSDRGTRVAIEGGAEPAVKPAGCPEGTAITVADLFFNTPARLKFLRAAPTEQGHIHDVVLGLALCHPEVGFRLTINGKEALSTVGAGSLREVVAALYGREAAEAMLDLAHGGPGGRVSGLACRPDQPRADRSRQFFFVNRRWVKHPALVKAVEEAYGGHIPPGRHPSFVMFLEVDPATVDVNVHPAKKEVRLGQSQRVYMTVVDALRQAFAQAWTDADYGLEATLGDAPPPGPGWGAGPTLSPLPPLRAAEASAALAFYAPLPTEDSGPVRQAALPTLEVAPPPGGAGLPREFEGLRVLFQLHRTYIVCEHPDGLFLLDQHNAQERWVYEQLQPAAVVTQALLLPQVLALSAREAGLAVEHGERLAALGFDLAPFGEGRWLLRGIPALLPLDEAEATVRELLSGAEHTGVVARQPDDDPLRRMIACHASIRAGEVLSMEQMELIVTRLRETRHPLTCPHGRPTGIMISMQELARRCLRA